MNKKRLFLLPVVFFAFFSYGCATCLHGTTQKIPVNTDPPGAKVSYAGNDTSFTTPCEIELQRKKEVCILTIEKAGYKSSNIEIRRVLSGAVAGNILAGGLIGWGVDAASGAQYRLIPESVNLNLDLAQSEEIPSAIRPRDLNEELDKIKTMLDQGKITGEEYQALRAKIIERF